MKRIAEIFGEPIADGGQEAFVYNVVSNFEDDEFAIDLLTPYYANDVPLTRLIKGRGGRVWAGGLAFTPGGLRTNIYKSTMLEFKGKDYDVAHIHSGSVSALALLARAASKAGIPKIIVHSHSTGAHKNFKYHLARGFSFPMMLVNATDYLACSKEAAEWKFPKSVLKNKLVIVNNGIEIENFVFDSNKRCDVRKALGIGEDVLTIGQVGRFGTQKNQTFALNVFACLRKGGTAAKFLLVGDGDERQNMQGLAKKLGIAHDTIFTGSVANTSSYYQAMDVLILPSIFEGLGIVALEAQASGIPVLASDAVPESVNVSGHVEFLSLSTDEHVWAANLLKLSETPRFDASKAFVAAGYDAESTAATIRNFYSD